jgi:hypothetical protein
MTLDPLIEEKAGVGAGRPVAQRSWQRQLEWIRELPETVRDG